MTISYFSEPWGFFTVKDFINTKELLLIRKELDSISEDQDLFKEEGKRINIAINPNFKSNIFNLVVPKFKQLCRTVDKLEEDNEEVIVEASIIKPGFSFPIHNDRSIKTLSFVLHISENGHGTRLYKNLEGEGLCTTMDWIPGGGGGFIRDDSHYHSFDTIEDISIRQTLLLIKQHKNVDHRRPDKHLTDKFLI